MTLSALTAMSDDDLLRCLRKVACPILAELERRGYQARVTLAATAAPDFAVTPKPTLAPG